MLTRPLSRVDGHLPIEDHGLIGDGATCVLVARDGSIPWLCLPEFDSPPFLAGLLDADRGGAFTMAPRGLRAGGQRYLDESNVLITELQGPDGVVELTDCMALRSGADLGELVPAGRSELLRIARVVSGAAELDVRLAPAMTYASPARAGPGASTGPPARTSSWCSGARTTSRSLARARSGGRCACAPGSG